MLFWDVDTQVDFMIPAGNLYVGGGEKIIPNLRRLTAWAGSHRVLVVSSACAHQPGDQEFAIFGPHCLAGTPGQQKVLETLLPNRYVVADRLVALPDLHLFQQIIIEKRVFDVFSNPNAEPILEQLGAGLRVVMYGVVTEICVASAANALLTRGHHVELVRDAVAALDEQKAARVLERFEEAGGRLVKTDDILKETPAPQSEPSSSAPSSGGLRAS
ncbi:MAG TPA: isochorismatase family cysteine hydrolase [Terriglobales bacterium]|nr:isochorismatase family cysteine hydrolase [Terriglobales bacterium]